MGGSGTNVINEKYNSRAPQGAYVILITRVESQWRIRVVRAFMKSITKQDSAKYL